MEPSASITDFKAQFVREFSYGDTPDKVMDADITRALVEAASVFNESIWDDTTEIKMAFCYASAHFMVLNIQNAGGANIQNQSLGLNSRGTGAVINKSVGNVSVAYSLPSYVTESPLLSNFLRTDFGIRYLTILAPRLVGHAYVVEGWSEDGAIVDAATTEEGEKLMITGNFNFSAASDISLYGSTVVHYMFVGSDILETNAEIVMSRGSIIKGLRVKCTDNTLNGSTVITVMKNGVAELLSVTLASGITTGADSLHTITLVIGDTISMKVDITASTTGVLNGLTASVVLT